LNVSDKCRQNRSLNVELYRFKVGAFFSETQRICAHFITVAGKIC